MFSQNQPRSGRHLHQVRAKLYPRGGRSPATLVIVTRLRCMEIRMIQFPPNENIGSIVRKWIKELRAICLLPPNKGVSITSHPARGSSREYRLLGRLCRFRLAIGPKNIPVVEVNCIQNEGSFGRLYRPTSDARVWFGVYEHIKIRLYSVKGVL